jgi:hypothetical protein
MAAPTKVVIPNTQRGRDLEEMKAGIITKREEARDALAFAEFAMATEYDGKHHAMKIAVGDRVYINFAKKDREGYKAAGVNAPKLGPQRAGLFKVLEMAAENACLVEVPPNWNIWPVINFRNLTKAPDTTDLYGRTTLIRRHFNGLRSRQWSEHQVLRTKGYILASGLHFWYYSSDCTR